MRDFIETFKSLWYFHPGERLFLILLIPLILAGLSVVIIKEMKPLVKMRNIILRRRCREPEMRTLPSAELRSSAYSGEIPPTVYAPTMRSCWTFCCLFYHVSSPAREHLRHLV